MCVRADFRQPAERALRDTCSEQNFMIYTILRLFHHTFLLLPPPPMAGQRADRGFGYTLSLSISLSNTHTHTPAWRMCGNRPLCSLVGRPSGGQYRRARPARAPAEALRAGGGREHSGNMHSRAARAHSLGSSRSPSLISAGGHIRGRPTVEWLLFAGAARPLVRPKPYDPARPRRAFAEDNKTKLRKAIRRRRRRVSATAPRRRGIEGRRKFAAARKKLGAGCEWPAGRRFTSQEDVASARSSPPPELRCNWFNFCRSSSAVARSREAKSTRWPPIDRRAEFRSTFKLLT